MARMRLGDMLIAAGLIDEMQLSAALAHQRQWGGRLGDVLLDKGFLDEVVLYRGLARQMNVPLVSILELDPPRQAIQAVPVELCKKHDLFPVALADREVTIAMVDPSNVPAVDEVAFRTGLRVRTVLAPSREIEWAHRRYFQGDNRPCPPPRTKTERVPTGMMEILQVGGGARVSAPVSPETTEGDALPPDPTLHLGDPVLTKEDPVERLGESLEDTTHLLRLLVETCVSRGIFTREEYLERVRRMR